MGACLIVWALGLPRHVASLYGRRARFAARAGAPKRRLRRTRGPNRRAQLVRMALRVRRIRRSRIATRSCSSCASREGRLPAGERSECEPKPRIVTLTVRSDHESSTARAAVGPHVRRSRRRAGPRRAQRSEASTPGRVTTCHGGASRASWVPWGAWGLSASSCSSRSRGGRAAFSATRRELNLAHRRRRAPRLLGRFQRGGRAVQQCGDRTRVQRSSSGRRTARAAAGRSRVTSSAWSLRTR